MRINIVHRNGIQVARFGGEFRKVESSRFFAGVADQLYREPIDLVINLEEIDEITPLVIAGLERFGRVLRDHKCRIGFVVTPQQEREITDEGEGLEVLVRNMFRSEKQALKALF